MVDPKNLTKYNYPLCQLVTNEISIQRTYAEIDAFSQSQLDSCSMDKDSGTVPDSSQNAFLSTS